MSINNDKDTKEVADSASPRPPATGIKRVLLNIGISFFCLLSCFILSVALDGLSAGELGLLIFITGLILATGPILTTMVLWKARKGERIKKLLLGLAAWAGVIISFLVIVSL